MCSSLRKNASIQSVISYTEPKLHTGKTWYIDFTAYDPLEQKMKRKKYMLDGIPKLTDRRRRANEIITNLNVKLRSGWNPWANVENSRQYTPYIDIIQRYHIYLGKLYAAGTIKENTLKDYEKRLRVFEEYTAKHIMRIRLTSLSSLTSWITCCLTGIHRPEPGITTVPGCLHSVTG